MQLAPPLQYKQRPRSRPRNRTAQKILPNLLHLSSIQQAAERTSFNSLRMQHGFDLGAKFLAHPMLEGESKSTLWTIHDCVRERARKRVHQQLFGSSVNLPCARKCEDSLGQNMI